MIGFSFFKCDEMHLRWVFTVKTAVILLKKILEFMFKRVYMFKISFECLAWPSGNVMARRVEGPVFDGRTCLFFFFSSLLLFYFFLFSFCLVLFAIPPKSWRVPAIHIFPVCYGIFCSGQLDAPSFFECIAWFPPMMSCSVTSRSILCFQAT